jgi:hypothetical protein
MNHQIPDFLETQADFLSHLQAQLADKTPQEIGRRFAKFAQYIFLHTEIGQDFKLPEQRQETHDGGVDMRSESKKTSQLAYLQSKYTIKSVDEVDQIISKFRAFETSEKKNRQPQLFDDGQENEAKPIFVVITSSKVAGLVTKYRGCARPSVDYFQELEKTERLHFLDCEQVYQALLQAFKRSAEPPSSVELTFDTAFIRCDNVIVGILPVGQLRVMYQTFGDSLFLENIREWLGPHGGKQNRGSRESPNQAITRTLHDAPSRFLARNNGLTIRTKSVERKSDRIVVLKEASIVNGCQTTMAIVDAGEGIDAKVIVKIVETEDSWDVAQAANFQTNLERMELELARDLRPQLVRAEAQKSGVRFSSESTHRTAFSVIEELYSETISYEEYKSLFVGLFSRNPTNSFHNIYSELRGELLAALQACQQKENFYEKLFRINIAARSAAKKQFEKIDKTPVGDLFQRFWKEDRATYRSYVTLLALAYLADGKAGLPVRDFSGLLEFVDLVTERISSEESAMDHAYKCAFKAIALHILHRHPDKQEQLQTMFREIQDSKFDNLLAQARLIDS